MKRPRLILVAVLALLMGGCGAVWKLSYTFPGTVSLEVKANVSYPPLGPATLPAEARR